MGLKQMVDCLKIAEGKQATAEERVETLTNENAQIQSDWDDDQRQNEREIQNLESIISQLQNDNRELEELQKTPEDKSENEAASQLKSELENSRREIEQAQETIPHLEKRLEENKSEQAEVEARLKTDIEGLQRQLEEKDSEILGLKAKGQEDQEKIDHEEDNQNRLKHENLQLLDRLQNIEEDMKTIEKSRDDVLQEVRDLEKATW